MNKSSSKKSEALVEYWSETNAYQHLLSPKYQAYVQANVLDKFGRVRTQSLFWETRASGRKDMLPFFTIKDKPHTVQSDFDDSMITYPSLKQVYFSYDHIPGMEYEFASEVFGSWDVWLKLNQSVLKDLFQQWRDELDIKLKAEAIKKIIVASKQVSSSGVAAAKYLADKGYMDKKVGRITNEEKERVTKEAAGMHRELEADMLRLGMQVVNGGK